MPPRRHIAWIACLAVLFNLLAMPLSRAAPKGPAEQLLWGAFCSSMANKGKVDVQALAKIERGEVKDLADVAAMLDRGLVERSRAWELFRRIEPELYRYPAVDPPEFRRAVRDALGEDPAG